MCIRDSSGFADRNSSFKIIKSAGAIKKYINEIINTYNAMNTSEIKNLIISSMNVDVSRKLEEEGISYNFSQNFGDKVLNKLFSAGLSINREVEFVKYMNFAFY